MGVFNHLRKSTAHVVSRALSSPDSSDSIGGVAPFDLNFLHSNDEYFIFYVTGSILCILCAAVAAGLTMGFLSLDPFKMRILLKTGTEQEKQYVRRIVPVLQDHHRIMATLLLFNTVANESLPVFLDALVPSWLSVLLSVTGIFLFCELMPQAFMTGPKQLQIAASCANFMRCLMVVFAPFAKPLAWLMDKVLLEDGHDDDMHATGDEEEANIAFSAGELSAMIDIVTDAAVQQGIMKADQDSERGAAAAFAVQNPMLVTEEGGGLGFVGHEASGMGGNVGDASAEQLAHELAARKDLVVHRHRPTSNAQSLQRQDSTGSTTSDIEEIGGDVVGILPTSSGRASETVETKSFLNRSVTPAMAKYRRYGDEKQYAELEAEAVPGFSDTETKKEDMTAIVTLLLRLSVGTMKRGFITPLQFVTPNAFQDRDQENKQMRKMTEAPSVGHVCCIPNDTVLDFKLLERLSDANNASGGLALVHQAGRTSCFLGCVAVADIISIMAAYKSHEHRFDLKPLSRTSSNSGLPRTLSSSAAPIPIGGGGGGGGGGRSLSSAKEQEQGGSPSNVKKEWDTRSNVSNYDRDRGDLPTIADVPLLMPLVVDEAASLLTTLRQHQQWLLSAPERDRDRGSIGASAVDGSKEPPRCDLVLVCHNAAKFREHMQASKPCHADTVPIGAMTLSDLLQSAEAKRARASRKMLQKRRLRDVSRYIDKFNSQRDDQNNSDCNDRTSSASEDEEVYHIESDDDDDDKIRRESEHVIEYIRSSFSAAKSVPTGNSRAVDALMSASHAAPVPQQTSHSLSLDQLTKGTDLYSTSLSKSGLTLHHLDELRNSIRSNNSNSPRGSISQQVNASPSTK